MLVLLRQGYTDVVDADLSRYFDTIPHQELMQSIARRIVDPNMLRLIEKLLNGSKRQSGNHHDGDGKRRMEGERKPTNMSHPREA